LLHDGEERLAPSARHCSGLHKRVTADGSTVVRLHRRPCAQCGTGVCSGRLSLNVAQLEAYLDPPPKALWADDEAKRRMVTCATLLAEDSDGRAARVGEVVILRRSEDRGPSVVEALASLPVRQ